MCNAAIIQIFTLGFKRCMYLETQCVIAIHSSNFVVESEYTTSGSDQ